MGGTFVVDVTASDGVTTAMDAFTVTIDAPPVLTLSQIPELGVATDGGSRAIDLWDYTNYYKADKTGLTYIITQTYTGYMTFGLADHIAYFTTTSSIENRKGEFDLSVTDGDLVSVTSFTLWTNDPPKLNFYPSFNPVPNPFYATTGRRNFLTLEGGETVVPLEKYEDTSDIIAYTFDEDVPDLLGTEIITGDYGGCLYTWCHYITFSPAHDFFGTYHVDVTAWDYYALSDTDSITVTVLQETYLPFMSDTYPPIPTLNAIDNADGDGIYTVQWEPPGDASGFYYELQHADNPSFTDATPHNTSSAHHFAETLTPGTYYWRVRVTAPSGEDPYPWSNVRSVSVGNFAYLYVEPLCAYGLRVELFGPQNYSVEYEDDWCGDVDYWRSVPGGTYTTRLTWIDGSIVENVPATFLGNGNEYIIRADEWPDSRWKPY